MAGVEGIDGDKRLFRLLFPRGSCQMDNSNVRSIVVQTSSCKHQKMQEDFRNNNAARQMWKLRKAGHQDRSTIRHQTPIFCDLCMVSLSVLCSLARSFRFIADTHCQPNSQNTTAHETPKRTNTLCFLNSNRSATRDTNDMLILFTRLCFFFDAEVRFLLDHSRPAFLSQGPLHSLKHVLDDRLWLILWLASIPVHSSLD